MAEFVNVPNRYRRLGWFAWREAITELISHREACWWLTRREIATRYRQSVIGIGWAILTPIAIACVFVFLNETKLVDVGPTPVTYALFLYAGLLPWQLFQGCLTRSTYALVNNPGLVARVRFPREVVVLSAIGSALFDFLVGTFTLILLLIWFRTVPAWTAVFLPAVIAGQTLLALALGLSLSALNAIVRDLGRVVPLAAMLWLFLTPVFYPPTQEGAGAWLNWLNPMNAFIVTWRDLLLEGTVSMPLELGCAFGVSLVLLAVGWRLFHVTIDRVAELI